jgi:hypothetical protein
MTDSQVPQACRDLQLRLYTNSLGLVSFIRQMSLLTTRETIPKELLYLQHKRFGTNRCVERQTS